MSEITSIFGEIYVHTCTDNGRSYVGQTTAGVPHRWCDQVKITRWPRNPGYRYPLSNAIRKYGKAAFEHQVLSVAQSKDELDNLEKIWIILLQARRPNGYNLAAGGEGNPGLSHTAESIAKMKANRTGKAVGNQNAAGSVRTPEFRLNVSSKLKGKKFSAEHNEKIRLARTGVKRPDVAAANNRRWAAVRAARAVQHGS